MAGRIIKLHLWVEFALLFLPINTQGQETEINPNPEKTNNLHGGGISETLFVSEGEENSSRSVQCKFEITKNKSDDPTILNEVFSLMQEKYPIKERVPNSLAGITTIDQLTEVLEDPYSKHLSPEEAEVFFDRLAGDIIAMGIFLPTLNPEEDLITDDNPLVVFLFSVSESGTVGLI